MKPAHRQLKLPGRLPGLAALCGFAQTPLAG